MSAALEIRGRRLEYTTIAWNTIEGFAAIGSGIVAGSIALVGFGLDSFIEVFAAAVVLWRMLGASEEREHTALRCIGLSFFALAAYLLVDASHDLITMSKPETSTVGIIVTVVSLLVMPLLARAKRDTGQRLGNASLVADAKESRLCAYLSASVLVGLALHSLFGWWWADPLAALVIAALAVREGREAWSGETCC